jgi:hypothetical protein
MQSRLFRFAIPAVLAASIPAAAVLAQSQAPAAPRGPSPEVQARLQDGRIAMIKESLKLNNDQLRLWGPVEEQLRASFKARQDARAERRERREQGAQRPTLPDRLDHASKRMAERAERMRSFAETVKPLYASLSEDQKAVAAVVLRRPLGMGEGRGRRWAMHRASRPDQK